MLRRLAPALALVLIACGDDAADPGALDGGAMDLAIDMGADAGAPDLPLLDLGAMDEGVPSDEIVLGGERPVTLQVPEDYAGESLPLVLSLHGYTSNGAEMDAYFGLPERVDERRFFLLSPTGTEERSSGNPFWNATDACCNFFRSPVDDVAYLTGLIDEAAARVAVDPARVYVVGHSNGGFMSYRLACDAADRIAAIVSLAGSTHGDAMECGASEPVSVLQIHGTLDSVIAYEGGALVAGTYPGAEETVERWARRAGCTGEPTPGDPIDLVRTLPGAETEVLSYATACDPGIGASLWTIEGGNHVPFFQADYADRLLDFLFAHPKP
ncbi:MAG: alpha/beta fold hydrolase [Myxococcota bacterium]